MTVRVKSRLAPDEADEARALQVATMAIDMLKPAARRRVLRSLTKVFEIKKEKKR